MLSLGAIDFNEEAAAHRSGLRMVSSCPQLPILCFFFDRNLVYNPRIDGFLIFTVQYSGTHTHTYIYIDISYIYPKLNPNISPDFVLI